jgi:hypothetical protein
LNTGDLGLCGWRPQPRDQDARQGAWAGRGVG